MEMLFQNNNDDNEDNDDGLVAPGPITGEAPNEEILKLREALATMENRAKTAEKVAEEAKEEAKKETRTVKNSLEDMAITMHRAKVATKFSAKLSDDQWIDVSTVQYRIRIDFIKLFILLFRQ